MQCVFLLVTQLCDAVQSLPAKVHYPIDLDPSSVKGKFSFHTPAAVKVVGSYLLKSAIKPDLNVDLALQIPEVKGEGVGEKCGGKEREGGKEGWGGGGREGEVGRWREGWRERGGGGEGVRRSGGRWEC